MFVKADLHVHSSYCDGKDTPEDIVKEAIGLGMETIGFSSHAHTPFYEDWCMSPERSLEYIDCVRDLQERYRGKIRVLLGIEWDYYSDVPQTDYDYKIGSVHFLPYGNEMVPVDYSGEVLLQAAEKYAGGDMLRLAADYYDLLGNVVEKTACDIIGHFDLITKFNEKQHLFDEHHPRYIKAWKQAADRLLTSGKCFEINTGAIARGYRSCPYPSTPIYEYLKMHGAHFVLNSDAHDKKNLMYGFEQYKDLLV